MQNRILWTTLLLVLSTGRALAQTDADACRSLSSNGRVLDCAAAGSLREQLRTATFIAGSATSGDVLALAIGLEIATAPLGSSMSTGGHRRDPQLNFTPELRTFGPSFSDRALTIGRNKINAGFNVLSRTYDSVDGLDLSGVSVLRFQGGSLPVGESRLDLRTHTDTVAGFAHFGVRDNLDIGLAIPYVRVSVSGTSRIFSRTGEELQRVRFASSSEGISDVAIFGKYRFWELRNWSLDKRRRHAALAAVINARLPTGDSDRLLGLGLGRTLVSLVGSVATGRMSSHANMGYELWSDDITVPRDFQNRSTISIKNQVRYSAGGEVGVHPNLTIIGDVIGRFQQGGGRIGYQTYFFPPNLSGVQGADALVGVPGGFHTVAIVPGARWNFYGGGLLTGHVLITVTNGGLRDRVTPVLGIDWAF